MRLADYVIERLAAEGIGHAFTVCGGGSIFLCDALAKSKAMDYVACHHEQGAAFAAEGYARARTGLGLCVVTCGPGGTNAVTGAAAAWTDHVPVVYLSGQAFLAQTIGDSGLRTKGVQELDIVAGVRPYTKYAAMVTEPHAIRRHLDEALYKARHGRPGPVWLDLPADVQNAKIDPQRLEGWEPHGVVGGEVVEAYDNAAGQAARVLEMLGAARRPLLHVGQGVRLSGAVAEFLEFVQRTGIPVVTARNGNDLIDSAHPCYVGRPGTFAQRGANFAVQGCDVYLAIGTRLSLAQTGYNARDYARNAKVVMVDVDRAELHKNTLRVDLKVQCDAGAFLRELLKQSRLRTWPGWELWRRRCKDWQAKYPPVSDAQRTERGHLNSYALVDRLSDALTPEDIVVTDMGFAFQNTHQAFRVKAGQRLMTNCGLAPMGWGLPAAIGAAIGTGRRVVCIAGDGGLMMNVQELATLAHHRANVKLFVLNNGGYLTMRQSQANAFDAYMGSDAGSGLSFPDFGPLAHAYRIPFWRLRDHHDASDRLRGIVDYQGPVFCEVMMDVAQDTIPKSINRRDAEGRIVQTPIEDAWPHLPRAELEEAMQCER